MHSYSRSRPNRFRRSVYLIGVAILFGAFLWLVIPGLGPNLFGLPELSLRGNGQVASTHEGENDELIAQLDSLPIENASQTPTYVRSEFGDGWADLDGDGCSTRNEILARDLSRPTFKPGSGNCVVLGGTLAEPYMGQIVTFVKGEKTSQEVQIDHVVPLANAWRSGAWQWSSQERIGFSNDPLNLLAVDGQANYEKGSKTADQWLPENQEFQCEYVARQVAVKVEYDLSVTKPEADTMRQILSSCPKIDVTLWH